MHCDDVCAVEGVNSQDFNLLAGVARCAAGRKWLGARMYGGRVWLPWAPAGWVRNPVVAGRLRLSKNDGFFRMQADAPAIAAGGGEEWWCVCRHNNSEWVCVVQSIAGVDCLGRQRGRATLFRGGALWFHRWRPSSTREAVSALSASTAFQKLAGDPPACHWPRCSTIPLYRSITQSSRAQHSLLRGLCCKLIIPPPSLAGAICIPRALSTALSVLRDCCRSHRRDITAVAPRYQRAPVIAADPHAQPTPHPNTTPRSTPSQTVATGLRSTRSPASLKP